MFWRVIMKNMSLYACEDKISFMDLQILNALVDMQDDFEGVSNKYFDEKMEREK